MGSLTRESRTDSRWIGQSRLSTVWLPRSHRGQHCHNTNHDFLPNTTIVSSSSSSVNNGFWWELMDVFIGTTLHGCSSPWNSLLKCPETRQGTFPIDQRRIRPTSENEKKKDLKIKTLFSFHHSKYREPICGLIPICEGINHTLPYLLGSHH